MEPSVSPELEEESIIIVYAGLETGLYATNMERGGELRVFELPGRAFIFGCIEERYDKNKGNANRMRIYLTSHEDGQRGHRGEVIST